MAYFKLFCKAIERKISTVEYVIAFCVSFTTSVPRFTLNRKMIYMPGHRIYMLIISKQLQQPQWFLHQCHGRFPAQSILRSKSIMDGGETQRGEKKFLPGRQNTTGTQSHLLERDTWDSFIYVSRNDAPFNFPSDVSGEAKYDRCDLIYSR